LVIRHNECIWVDPYNKNNFTEGILKASSLNVGQKQTMNEANGKTLSAYDYSKTIRDFLKRNKSI